MRTRVLWIVVMSLGLSACDLEVLQPKDEYVAVVGRSTLSVPPDKLSFTARIEKVGETPGGAQKRVSEQASSLIESLLEFGLEPSDLTTQNIYVRPAYEEVVVDGETLDKQIGFEGIYDLEITTEKLDELDQILRIVVENSAIYDDLSYALKDEKKLHSQVRESAIANAQQKADDYAKSAGRLLGASVIIEEPDVNRYRLKRSRIGGGLDEIVVTAYKAESGFSVPIIPPNVEIELEIFTKFQLE